MVREDDFGSSLTAELGLAPSVVNLHDGEREKEKGGCASRIDSPRHRALRELSDLVTESHERKGRKKCGDAHRERAEFGDAAGDAARDVVESHGQGQAPGHALERQRRERRRLLSQKSVGFAVGEVEEDAAGCETGGERRCAPEQRPSTSGHEGAEGVRSRDGKVEAHGKRGVGDAERGADDEVVEARRDREKDEIHCRCSRENLKVT